MATILPVWLVGFGRFVEQLGIMAIFKALDRSLGAKISNLIDRPRAIMVMFLA